MRGCVAALLAQGKGVKSPETVAACLSVMAGRQPIGSIREDRDLGTDRIAFLASETGVAQETRERLALRYGDHPLEDADVVVALGGDGFMLQTLHATEG